ncbi:hypothetical protein ASG01_01520 [Chryseobacterium sp. Leaf180]|uniref:PH domain-containing protein n=1 Tax=Chryseobacterium sp. Leaf180 TaxID=1736289 RepID=UPI0006F58332|nr:PH domain-containing protein [Chryseobacterium sp. Leaf180]KQR94589.1 hypothetical protein ASG01_01520 [Chryseobacterium sp. Leaf180]
MNKNNSFFSPQRQSKIGIVLLFLYNAADVIKNSWFFLVFLWLKKDKFNLLFVATAVILGFVLLLVSAFLRYYNFTYQIDDETDEFIIKKGIFNKSVTRIKTDKVQEVIISQPFTHRIFNIFKLEIDSPGSSEKEVVIPALSRQNALDLKLYLTESKIVGISEENIPAERFDLLNEKIPFFNLLRYGFTANYIQSFFAFLSVIIYVISKLENFLRESDYADRFDYGDFREDILKYSLVAVAVAVIILFIIGITVNSVRNIIQYFGFKIVENKRSFSLEHGLFSTKNFIVNKRKVQVVAETQNWLQKKLKISSLKLLQIGSNEHEKKSAKIPGISDEMKNQILVSLWKEKPVFTEILKPNIRWLLLNTVIFVVFPSVFAIYLFSEFIKENILAFILILIFAEAILFGMFKKLTMKVGERFIEKKSGLWDVDTHTFEIEKLQTVKISQYFWQRKTNLGKITFYTSAGNYGLSALDFFKVKKLMNFALFKIETSKDI